MELPKEKAVLKRELEGQRSVFVDIIVITENWIKMVSSLPAHSYQHYEADVGSFIDQGRTVQAHCIALVRRIDNLRECEEGGINECWDERNRVAALYDPWKKRVDQVIAQFESVLDSLPAGNA